MVIRCLLCIFLVSLGVVPTGAQTQVPIESYTVGSDGRVRVRVSAHADSYYLLQLRHAATTDDFLPVSLTPGQDGPLTLTEPAAAYPRAHYRVLAYPRTAPGDADGDGVDDLTELAALPLRSPLNAAPPVARGDGTVALDQFDTFRALSLTRDRIQWSEFLNGKGYVKFIITDFYTEQPKLYFIDSRRHYLHADFAEAVGIDHLGEQIKKGQVIYHPQEVAASGQRGTFAFNYSNGHGDDFATVRRTYELLAANMPFLTNNLAYYVTALSEDEYARDLALYRDARLPLLYESDVFAAVDYLALNPQRAYGIFRRLGVGELPGPRDVVLYDALPNDLPRVAGIVTSVVQTPLSHVNLRAIQNELPNAYIRDPLGVDSLAQLLDGPVYYEVRPDGYVLREATTEEVNEWFEDLRPAVGQRPPLNLRYTEILPLDAIRFAMYDGFGAKCANVATMRGFGFPEGVIPQGFGVPFYFYREFMRHNDFFVEVEKLLTVPGFATSRDVRREQLATFRQHIAEAELPDWMLDALAAMQASFPAGTAIRCRSSTNNEDLPGFNGAGLYDSKTQYPNEGHIAKSIKQVYASLWNLRAFEEREYHRVDHLAAAMGVLCHANYPDEQANGVAVTTDPLYNTRGTFYLNTQLGDELVTNPDPAAAPEEVLLERVYRGQGGHILVQRSTLTDGERLLSRGQLDALRDYLTVIHDEFARLYKAAGDPTFAMDVEYKITQEGQLSIKQARPWVSYRPEVTAEQGVVDHADPPGVFPNPAGDYTYLADPRQEVAEVIITDVVGREVRRVRVAPEAGRQVRVPLTSLHRGVYLIAGLSGQGELIFVNRVVRR